MVAGDAIGARERMVQVVAVGLMTGVVIMGGAAYVLVRSGAFQSVEGPAARVALFAGIAVLAMGLLTANVLAGRLRGSLKGLTEQEIIHRYALLVVVPAAVREGVGLFGIVAGMLAGSPIWILIFSAASVGSQAMAFPRAGDLQAQLRRGRPAA